MPIRENNKVIVITILIATITFLIGITVSSLAIRDDVTVNTMRINTIEKSLETTNAYLRAIIEQNNLILLKMKIEPVRVGK